jgi:hypothetical protein
MHGVTSQKTWSTIPRKAYAVLAGYESGELEATVVDDWRMGPVQVWRSRKEDNRCNVRMNVNLRGILGTIASVEKQ